jgi:hypothetical protein
MTEFQTKAFIIFYGAIIDIIIWFVLYESKMMMIIVKLLKVNKKLITLINRILILPLQKTK